MFFDPQREVFNLRDLERTAGKPILRKAIPCGPEVVRRQAEALAISMTKTSSLIPWLKPVADELRKSDLESGTDSMAALLSLVLGGDTKMKVFSALNGRSGNQTLMISPLSDNSGNRLDMDVVNEFMKSLPIYKSVGKGTLVRDFHRVKKSSAVMADVAPNFVSEMIAHGPGAGLKVESIEGTLPDSTREFTDSRTISTMSRSGGFSRGGRSGDRGGFRSNNSYGGGSNSYGGGSSRREDQYGGSRSGGSSSSGGGGGRSWSKPSFSRDRDSSKRW